MSGQKVDLLRCTPDVLILRVLSIGLMHGYGVGQRVMQLEGELLTVEEGSLYPSLYRLEERGLVKSDRGKSEDISAVGFIRWPRRGARGSASRSRTGDCLSW